MEHEIKKALLQDSEELFGRKIDASSIQFQKTRKDVEGDLTLVVFPFAKLMGSSPVDAGNKIGQYLLKKFEGIEKVEVINGFVNVIFSDDFWVKSLFDVSTFEKFGFERPNSKPLVMVEYASPNTNKPLHLGHLRNIFLGDAVASILKAYGHKIIRTQVINDRGIHICKSMLAWERFAPIKESGERENPNNAGIKGDKLVGKYYVEFDKRMNEEAKAIIQEWEKGQFEDYPIELVNEVVKLINVRKDKDLAGQEAINSKIKELAKNQTPLLRDAKEMLVKWEARDPQVYLLWTTMNGWVYEGFEATYQKMGVAFDKLYYESDTFLLGKDIIIEGLNKGVFFRKEDGSVWIDLRDEGLDEKLVLRSDGTAVYMTQDIGTAVDRYKDYPDLSRIIYTVGNEQDYHFKVLFLILQKMGYDWANQCAHLSYGMVDLPSGKMKSREGTVVDADDLMDEVITKATEMTKERGHLEGMTEAEMKKLYHLIGIGGLKYYLLKVDPKKRMLFNPEESIELNGNTGPFIQYAYARIQSLIAKVGQINESIAIEHIQLNSDEKEIIKILIDFPNVLAEAAQQLSPALIANYSYELVKTYNHFYQNVSVLKESDPMMKRFRIQLSKQVGEVIKNTMQLLGIEVPVRM
jgi:arginyl-tRNA synthetase